MTYRQEDFDARLTSLRRQLAEYGAELRKITAEVDVTWQVKRVFDHLITIAIHLGMTRDEIHNEFQCLNTSMTQVVNLNPNGGYFQWSIEHQKYVWVSIDSFALSLMSPLEHQNWLFDHGKKFGVKNVPLKAPPPRPLPRPSAETAMVVTVEYDAVTGMKSTTYMPRRRSI